MAKKITDLRNQLRQYKFDNNLLQKIDCSYEENKEFTKLVKTGQPLPEGVLQHKPDMGGGFDGFYRLYTSDLSNDEIAEYLTYKQLDVLKTIKGYLTFFVTLTIIGIIGILILYGMR